MIRKTTDAPANVEQLTLYSYLDSERYIIRFLDKLASNNIVTVGDLLRAPDRDLFREFPTTSKNITVFKDKMSKIGIEFTR